MCRPMSASTSPARSWRTWRCAARPSTAPATRSPRYYRHNIIDGLLGADTMSGAPAETPTMWTMPAITSSKRTAGTDNAGVCLLQPLGQEWRTCAAARLDNGTGNSIANIITGNSGNNIIDGLLGADTLSGSTGNDSFVFTTALNASTMSTASPTSGGRRHHPGDNAIFVALGGNGTLTADQFIKNTTAEDGNDHIIYETDTGWPIMTATAGGRLNPLARGRQFGADQRRFRRGVRRPCRFARSGSGKHLPDHQRTRRSKTAVGQDIRK